MKEDFKLETNEIEKLCEAGAMAPSGGNTQPWKVLIRKNVFEIKLDPKRSDSFIDVGRYASIFSLGCFTENVCIVADYMGIKYELQFIDSKKNNDPFVRISFKSRQKGITSAKSLYPFIKKRTTNRQLYDGAIIDKNDFNSLAQILKNFDKNFRLTFVSSHEKKVKAADILGKADGIRLMNDRLFNEMMGEFRWSQKEVLKTRDGLDLKTLELPGNADKMFLLLKKFPFARKIIPKKALERFARPLMLGCSHLCCLSFRGKPTPHTMFLAGRLIERLWLTATKLNLAIQPWTVFNFILIRATYYPNSGLSRQEENESLQIGKDFRQLYKLYKTGFPLFIFRLSKAKAPSAHSLRIPWQEYTKVNL